MDLFAVFATTPAWHASNSTGTFTLIAVALTAVAYSSPLLLHPVSIKHTNYPPLLLRLASSLPSLQAPAIVEIQIRGSLLEHPMHLQDLRSYS